MENDKLFIDEDLYKKLKYKYKVIYELTADYNDKVIYAYLKKPNKTELFRFFSLYFTDKMTAKCGLFNSLVLEKSPEIDNDDELFISFANNVFDTITLFQTEIKTEDFDVSSSYYTNISTIKEKIYQIKIFNETNTYFIYLKKPNRNSIIKYYNLSDIDIITAGSSLITDCFITGDDLNSNDEAYVSLLLKVNDIVNIYSTTIKKK